MEADPEISEVVLLNLVGGAVDPEVASLAEFAEVSEEEQEAMIEQTLRLIEKQTARAEVWKCRDAIRDGKDLVTLAADFELEVGHVRLGEQRHRVTLAWLSGFERNGRWPCKSAIESSLCALLILKRMVTDIFIRYPVGQARSSSSAVRFQASKRRDPRKTLCTD